MLGLGRTRVDFPVSTLDPSLYVSNIWLHKLKLTANSQQLLALAHQQRMTHPYQILLLLYLKAGITNIADEVF